MCIRDSRHLGLDVARLAAPQGQGVGGEKKTRHVGLPKDVKRRKGASDLPVDRRKAAFVKIVEVEIRHPVGPLVASQVLEMRVAAYPCKRGASRRKRCPVPEEKRRRPPEKRESVPYHPHPFQGKERGDSAAVVGYDRVGGVHAAGCRWGWLDFKGRRGILNRNRRCSTLIAPPAEENKN